MTTSPWYVSAPTLPERPGRVTRARTRRAERIELRGIRQSLPVVLDPWEVLPCGHSRGAIHNCEATK